MLKTHTKSKSVMSQIKAKFPDFDRLGEVDEGKDTMELKLRFENKIVDQQKWKVPLPTSKKKVEILTAVSEFISKTPNITQSIIRFRDQIKSSDEVILSLHDWGCLEIVFLGASMDNYDGQFDHLGSVFANHQTVCDEFSLEISNQLNLAQAQYQGI